MLQPTSSPVRRAALDVLSGLQVDDERLRRVFPCVVCQGARALVVRGILLNARSFNNADAILAVRRVEKAGRPGRRVSGGRLAVARRGLLGHPCRIERRERCLGIHVEQRDVSFVDAKESAPLIRQVQFGC